MSLPFKALWVVISISAVLALPACGPTATLTETAVVPTATPAQQTVKTEMGEFTIVSARLVDEVRDTKAPEGYQFLLIGLVGPDQQVPVPGEFSLEDFQAAMLNKHDEIYILGNNGTQTYYTQMGGWVTDEDFAIGFTVPAGDTYTLYWIDQAPIPLNVDQ